MAHTCPACGQWCYCNGDVDDAGLDLAEDVEACVHCTGDDGTNDCDGCTWDGDCKTVCEVPR